MCCYKVWFEKNGTALALKLAKSKKSTNFSLSLWNLAKIASSWVGSIAWITAWLAENCRFWTNTIFLVQCLFFGSYFILFWLIHEWMWKKQQQIFLSQIKSLHVLVGMTHYTQKKIRLVISITSKSTRFTGTS